MNIKNILVALIGINLVITVHEFGHWSMCHLFGVETPTFSIGFGPTLLEKKIGDTNFILALLPLGGYVEIAGMRQAPVGKEASSFITQPFGHKVLIMLGGIIFNILFALIVFMFVGFAPKIPPKTFELEEESTPSEQPKKQSGLIGPVGIINLISRSYDYGMKFYWYILAILSLNLAIFNLLPLPILDGGQLLIQTIEYVRGAPFPEPLYEAIMMVTIFLMLLLFLGITRQDIKNPV